MEKFTSSKTATLLKVTLLHGCFSRYLNYTNGTKSRKTSRFKPSDICSKSLQDTIGTPWQAVANSLSVFRNLSPSKEDR